MEKVGAINYYTVKDAKVEMGVKSSAAVIMAANKAHVGKKLLGRLVFSKSEIEKLTKRPHVGRPVGTGHPNGPRKAKVLSPWVAPEAVAVVPDEPVDVL